MTLDLCYVDIYLNLFFIFLKYFFKVAISPRPTSHHQIFQKNGKLNANFTLWFLDSFGAGRDVQKGHFRLGSSFANAPSP